MQPKADKDVPLEVGFTAGLRVIRLAKTIALEDGRQWHELSMESMDQYFKLARQAMGLENTDDATANR